MPLARAAAQMSSTITAVPAGLRPALGAHGREQSPGEAMRGRLDGRRIACAAGFYNDVESAQAVAAHLSQRFGLRGSQVAVLRPGHGRRTSRSSAGAHAMQGRTDRMPLLQRMAELSISAMLGVGVAGVVALMAWLMVGDGPADAVSEPTDWMLPAMLLGGLAGMLGGWLHDSRQPRRRFDETIARKLATGHSVVITAGLSTEQQLPVLAHLQRSSQSWCAEAPRSSLRL